MDGATNTSYRPTVADLTGDNHFAQLARTTWLTKSKPGKVSASTVKGDIWDPLESEAFSYSTLLLLEQLQTLERYLWPGYTDDSSDCHVLLLVLLTNAKKREGLPVWKAYKDSPDAFSSFFRRVLHISIDQTLGIALQIHVLTFIVNAFQSLEEDLVRTEVAPLVSIGIWEHLHSEAARDQHLAQSIVLQKAWRAAKRKYEGADASAAARLRFERSWLYTLVSGFLNKLYQVDVTRMLNPWISNGIIQRFMLTPLESNRRTSCIASAFSSCFVTSNHSRLPDDTSTLYCRTSMSCHSVALHRYARRKAVGF